MTIDWNAAVPVVSPRFMSTEYVEFRLGRRRLAFMVGIGPRRWETALYELVKRPDCGHGNNCSCLRYRWAAEFKFSGAFVTGGKHG